MRNNISLLQEKLGSEIKSDCAIITSDINRRYLTGMKSSAGTVLVFKDCAYLLIDFRYIEKARDNVTNCIVVMDNSTSDKINELLSKHNAKSVAVETASMTVSQYNNMKLSLEVEVLDSNCLSDVLSKMRSIKSDEEIESIIKAQRIAENAFSKALELIKAGVTERELALFLDFQMLSAGAEAVSFDTIALSGENTSLPHGEPSDKKIRKGEFVLMDFGAVVDGYHSDMTRTVCVGEPDEEMKKVYNIVLEAQEAALKIAKSDMTGKELDSVARNVLDKAGYGDNFGHSLGHCVGLEIHESPNASPRSEDILLPQMVITVEPGIYIEKKFGVRIEDMVVLTKNGCNNLTKSPKELIVL